MPMHFFSSPPLPCYPISSSSLSSHQPNSSLSLSLSLSLSVCVCVCVWFPLIPLSHCALLDDIFDSRTRSKFSARLKYSPATTSQLHVTFGYNDLTSHSSIEATVMWFWQKYSDTKKSLNITFTFLPFMILQSWFTVHFLQFIHHSNIWGICM